MSKQNLGIKFAKKKIRHQMDVKKI